MLTDLTASSKQDLMMLDPIDLWLSLKLLPSRLAWSWSRASTKLTCANLVGFIKCVLTVWYFGSSTTWQPLYFSSSHGLLAWSIEEAAWFECQVWPVCFVARHCFIMSSSQCFLRMAEASKDGAKNDYEEVIIGVCCACVCVRMYVRVILAFLFCDNISRCFV